MGSIFFLPVLFVPSTHLPHQFPWPGTLAVIYLGGIISVVAYFLYNYGLSRIPASKASAYVNLIPVFSVILGWLVLGEHLTSFQYLAAAAVLGGILTSRQGTFPFQNAGGKLQKMLALGNSK
jgi:drug/metabolite transporter (DMT)-like permease